MEVLKDIPVNDGGGFLDNIGLIDSLIVDCNNSTKALVSGNYVLYSSINVQMVQKLNNLKQGIKNDTEGLQKQIKDLKALLEEEGKENDAGSVHYTLEGTVGDREESLRDVITAAGGGLESDPDHAGA